MSGRHLYLAAYDIAHPRRLVNVLKVVRAYATGGQKSFYEIFLTDAEKALLLEAVESLIHTREDRFMLLRLDPRTRFHAFGVAELPSDPSFFYVG